MKYEAEVRGKPSSERPYGAERRPRGKQMTTQFPHLKPNHTNYFFARKEYENVLNRAACKKAMCRQITKAFVHPPLLGKLQVGEAISLRSWKLDMTRGKVADIGLATTVGGESMFQETLSFLTGDFPGGFPSLTYSFRSHLVHSGRKYPTGILLYFRRISTRLFCVATFRNGLDAVRNLTVAATHPKIRFIFTASRSALQSSVIWLPG